MLVLTAEKILNQACYSTSFQSNVGLVNKNSIKCAKNRIFLAFEPDRCWGDEQSPILPRGRTRAAEFAARQRAIPTSLTCTTCCFHAHLLILGISFAPAKLSDRKLEPFAFSSNLCIIQFFRIARYLCAKMIACLFRNSTVLVNLRKYILHL